MSKETPQLLPPGYVDPYLRQHPDAIQDENKAEIMAHASDRYESEAINARNQALEYADAPAGMTLKDAMKMAKENVHKAKEAKARSESTAKAVGDHYDQVHKEVSEI